MNILEEKKVIYEAMNQIMKEKNELTNSYNSLLKRLEKLDSLEIKSDSESKEFEETNNSVEVIDVDIEEKNEISDITKEEINIVEENNNNEQSDIKLTDEAHNIVDLFEIPEFPKEEKNLIPKEEIEIQKGRDKNYRYEKLSRDRATSLIVETLKEYNYPIKLKELHRVVNEKSPYEIKIINFQNNILPRAMQKNKNIKRVSRGFYEYKKD